MGRPHEPYHHEPRGEGTGDGSDRVREHELAGRGALGGALAVNPRGHGEDHAEEERRGDHHGRGEREVKRDRAAPPRAEGGVYRVPVDREHP